VLSRFWRVLTVHDPQYGDFADQRTLLGVPNGANVLSNAPFVVIGAWGLFAAAHAAVREPVERWPLIVLFAGVLATGFGSAYFHLFPLDERGVTNKATLFWDRLPIAIGFAGVMAFVLNTCVRYPLGSDALPWLATLGAATVLIWRYIGPFWPYAWFQLLGALGAFVVVLVRCPTHGWLVGGLLAYGVAKVCEDNDARFHAKLGISGHTLKHLFAALGALLIVFAL
jgi:hypothetical protein